MIPFPFTPKRKRTSGLSDYTMKQHSHALVFWGVD